MFCGLRDSGGKPGEGVHSVRLFDIAVMDVVGTIWGAYFVSRQFDINFYWTVFALFLVGILAHRLFCVRTTVDKIIFS